MSLVDADVVFIGIMTYLVCAVLISIRGILIDIRELLTTHRQNNKEE